ncbi:MAG TPA: iron ABC transporter substrate-binding protein [Thermoleophilaceae bacterium]|nr:iron ABC transporter substrate-binding protein [Thermoleophilaceae bacterium]
MCKLLPILGMLVAAALSGCGFGADGGPGELTIYSGREQDLVGPLLDRYAKEEGVDIKVRYGTTPEIAATLNEEGDRSPADVFFSQDAGALGSLQAEGRLERLPAAILDRVDSRFRSRQGDWVGISGRARVVAYNRERVKESDLPRSVLGLTAPRWKGKVGWAPTNASFESFVTALRKTQGEGGAERWLRAMKANDTQVYENNVAIRDAVAKGEIEVGLINHYYVAEARAQEGPDYPVDIYEPPGGDPGALVNVAGAAVIAGAEHREAARDFISFLLSRKAQRYFAERTKEYPLAAGVRPEPGLVPLSSIRQPDVDLADLADLQGTVDLLERTGVL